jgi:ABC-type multidrug transport system ATPase subunit
MVLAFSHCALKSAPSLLPEFRVDLFDDHCIRMHAVVGQRKEPVHLFPAVDQDRFAVSYCHHIRLLSKQQDVLLLQPRAYTSGAVWKCFRYRYARVVIGNHSNSTGFMILEFDGIEYGYHNRRLLTGVHVKCERGKITGLLGRNGTGKSTLMKVGFGAIRPDVASIRLDHRPLAEPPFALGVVSYLPQDSFVPTNVRLKRLLDLYAVSKEKVLSYFPELVSDFELYAPQVSGGRLRLFEVLLILFRSTPFCFLDEPFTGLSPLLVERLQQVLMLEKENKGILVSDHLFRQVLAIADNVYLLSNGSTFLIKEEEDLSRRGYSLAAAD